MGSRAAYIVKRDGVATAYGSHWGASSIMDDIFWGPDSATEALTTHEPLEELGDLYDGDEGSVLIDWDAKRLIWWARNCPLPVHQRLFNKLAARNWPGWQIETAAAHQDEILEYLGIDPYEHEETDEEVDGDYDEGELQVEGRYVADDDEEPGGGKNEEDTDAEENDEEEDEEEDEDEYEEEYEEEYENLIEEDALIQPEAPRGAIVDLDELESGIWISIRGGEGSWIDYFVAEYDDDDILQGGPEWFETLPHDRAIGAPAPELATVSGIVVDGLEKTIWRWKSTRFEEIEQELKDKWPDYRFRDLDDGWSEQVRLTDRLPGDLEANERQILGTVVAHLLGDSSIDHREMFLTAAGAAKGIRVGCLVVTLFVGLLGGLAIWLDSTVLAVCIAILFLLCLSATTWFWRKSAIAITMSDMMQPGDRFHRGLSTEEKKPLLSKVLVGAGFPSLEQLEAARELPSWYCPEDDEEDDEEEDDGAWDEEDDAAE